MFLPGVENRSESLYSSVENTCLSHAGSLSYVACPPGAAGSCDWLLYTYDFAQPSDWLLYTAEDAAD